MHKDHIGCENKFTIENGSTMSKPIECFSDLLDDICHRDSNHVFLRIAEKNYTYSDLLFGIQNPKKQYDKQNPFELLLYLFTCSLDHKVAILANYEPTLIDMQQSPFLIIATSGTTHVKYVMHREKALFDNIMNGIETIPIDKNDVSFSFVPFDHIFGLICGLLGPLVVGCTITVPNNLLTAINDLERYKPTYVIGMPIILKLVPPNIGIKTILLGGTLLESDYVCPPDTNVLFGYGSTECLCVSIRYLNGDHSGTIIKGYNVDIIEGEIVISGNIMIGYTYPNTGACTKFFTGDKGYIQDGILFISGRKDNVILFDDGSKLNMDELQVYLKSRIDIDCYNIEVHKTLLIIYVKHKENCSEDIYEAVRTIIDSHIPIIVKEMK